MHAAALTFSIPGGHGDDPIDSGGLHGTDHRFHGQGVSHHPGEERGGEAEAGHDHVLSFEMSLQAVCGENISFHHLEAAHRETKYASLTFYNCIVPHLEVKYSRRVEHEGGWNNHSEGTLAVWFTEILMVLVGFEVKECLNLLCNITFGYYRDICCFWTETCWTLFL